MAYNKYKKLTQLDKELGVKDASATWLPETFDAVNISIFLLQSLKDAKNEPLGTEKAKSEHIITPVLKELRRNNLSKFRTFSGYSFEVDETKGLNGYCDFILSAAAERADIIAPVFFLVEAKNDNVEKGFAQCGAEMYAATLFNAQQGRPCEMMYGCVTTGFLWCFLKLENNILYIDPNYITLTFSEPHKVLSVLQWILDESLKEMQYF
ncbi:MAG: hypothetical protein ACKVTZ_14640 [Bacteroidia bacterium]